MPSLDAKQKLMISKVTDKNLGVTQNALHSVLIHPDFIEIEQQTIPVTFKTSGLDTLKDFVEILSVDDALNIIKEQLNLQDDNIFKTRNCEQNISDENLIYHIKYNNDLITLKIIKDDRYFIYNKFHMKIRSDNETHQHSFSDILTDDGIVYLCKFIKFVCTDKNSNT